MADKVTTWPSGDIWEDYRPRCGREPVYFPKRVCKRCWLSMSTDPERNFKYN